MNLTISRFDNETMRSEATSVIYFLLVLLFVFTSSSSAQTFKATARIDTNTIKIGEQFHLILQTEAPAGYKFIFPQVPDTISKLEITDRSKIDTAVLQEK